jgi:hypothetical protein
MLYQHINYDNYDEMDSISYTLNDKPIGTATPVDGGWYVETLGMKAVCPNVCSAYDTVQKHIEYLRNLLTIQ